MSSSLILLSGGPDSATLAHWAKANGHDDLHGLYLRCGHPSDRQESTSADRIAAEVGATLEIIDLAPMVAALGGQRILIHSHASIMPFGNAIVLSLAVTYARRVGANRILIALHADDAKENAEYRRPFIDGIEALARDTQGDIRIVTPFLDKGKGEVFGLGVELGVDYSGTWSCVRPGTHHCGYCGACRARSKAFEACGVPDPTEYASPVEPSVSVPAGH